MESTRWRAPIHCRTATFDGSRTYVMGVLNLTPDSFSDGGRFLDPDAALKRAEAMIAQGADLIDVGGESTRPGAEPIDSATEWLRIAPLLRRLANASVPLSVDTYKAEIAERAIGEGVEIVNDVSGGRLDPRILEVCAAHDAVMVLSHLRGTPRTMMEGGDFADVFEEVAAELGASIERARQTGVKRIVGDPGIGFGKRGRQNLVLLARAGELARRLGVPLLVGPSRKAFLGALTGLPSAERGPATLAAAVGAAIAGASFVRVHDVAEAKQALAVADALVAATAPAQSTEGDRS